MFHWNNSSSKGIVGVTQLVGQNISFILCMMYTQYVSHIEQTFQAGCDMTLKCRADFT